MFQWVFREDSKYIEESLLLFDRKAETFEIPRVYRGIWISFIWICIFIRIQIPSVVPLSVKERWSFAVKFRTNESKSVQHLEFKNVVFALDKSKSYLYDYVSLKNKWDTAGESGLKKP